MLPILKANTWLTNDNEDVKLKNVIQAILKKYTIY